MNDFDPEIMQDFLTEASELLSQLEIDLVALEGSPSDDEMINRVFRALHTIKGSASFLSLAPLVRIAHASESALNMARSGKLRIDRGVMDLLLQAVDLVKTQMGQLREGQPLTEPLPALLNPLTALGEGTAASATTSAAPELSKPAAAEPSSAPAGDVRPLVLTGPKADLFEFLVSDLDDTLAKVRESVHALMRSAPGEATQRAGAAMAEQAEQLARAVEFFECDAMVRLARLVFRTGESVSTLSAEYRAQAYPRLLVVCSVLDQMAAGIKVKEIRSLQHALLEARLNAVLAGEEIEAAGLLPEGADEQTAAGVDQITASAAAPASAATTAATTTAPAAKSDEADAGRKAQQSESTIRVEVGRLETLMNLVGELVLQKNRVMAMVRRAQQVGGDPSQIEAMTAAAGGLDRVTGDIQTAVMRTRMQPLDKLFGRYPRLIRDMCGKTGKKIQLVIEGGETEVDKSVIEELADPLVHLLRNSADHGLEPPQERLAAGKSETGTITLRATQEGGHVRILVIDDGRGLSRQRIGDKAVERGLIGASGLAGMTDREVFKYIFEAGFSTAEKVSDLSGRGVGMDVVRTNITKLKGNIDLASEAGKGTTTTVTIPLTVAILPAMMVGVAREVFAVPLNSILEIVRPTQAQRSTIGERSVMRLRDSVLPLVSAQEIFGGTPPSDSASEPFAVVLAINDQRVGLLVSRLIGQQEVVIKPLDDLGGERRHRAVSGATVRDDGGVSLIVDVTELMSIAERSRAAA